MKKFILTIILIISFGAPARAEVQEEYVKAAFIFHFINFTQWEDNWSDYYVCIPGDVSLRTAAQELLRGKLVNGRKIVVVNRAKQCHVLVSNYVPPTDHTLTIGSLNKGALLEFRKVDQKLRFAVNPEGVKKSRLKISSQLLKLAILDEGG